MTISTTSSQATYLGNGVTNPFSFSFIVGIASNVNVYYTANGVQTLLSPSQYTLSLTAPVTGSIWGVGGTVTYPTTGSPIANGTSLTISRVVPLTQLDSISNQGTLLLSVIETALDTLCLEIQQVSGKTGQLRGVWVSGTVYNYGDVVQDGVNGANTGNYYMCGIQNTSGTWSTDLAAGDWSLAINVQQIAGYATAAAASAAAALVSQGAAASSSTASAASAATSTTEAGVATTQAGISTTQAGIATTQATAAGVSAATASTEAGVATTQAGIATTQATASSNSATASAASAAAALVSQNASAASATQAASKFTGTSTTSNTIGTGALTFTTQANLGFSTNQFVVISANSSNYVTGTVTSYNNSTGVLVINSTNDLGSGTFALWTINLAGEPGTGTGSVTSVGTGAGLTGGPITTIGTISIPSNGVTLAMLAAQAADTFLANNTSGSASPSAIALASSQLAGRGSTGDIAAISLGAGLSISGTILSSTVTSEIVLLGTATAATSASLNFTSLISSSYSMYILVINSLLAGTSAAHLLMGLSTNNGSTYVANAKQQNWYLNLNSTAAPNYSDDGTGVSPCTIWANSNSGSPFNGFITFSIGATTSSTIVESSVVNDASGFQKTFIAAGFGTVINAVNLSPSSGTFTSGTAYLYGVKNT